MAKDDRLSRARNIGVLNGTRTFKDSLGVRDKNDYYAFTVTRRSSFNLLLNNLRSDIDVSLIQNGRTIANSSNKKNRSEKIAATLEPGVYYVRVFQKQGGSQYQMSLKTVSSSQPISPGQPTSADLFYNNVFLSATSDAYSCGLTNDSVACLSYQRASSVLFDGCVQGNRTACSLSVSLAEIEAAGRLAGMIGSF